MICSKVIFVINVVDPTLFVLLMIMQPTISSTALDLSTGSDCQQGVQETLHGYFGLRRTGFLT